MRRRTRRVRDQLTDNPLKMFSDKLTVIRVGRVRRPVLCLRSAGRGTFSLTPDKDLRNQVDSGGGGFVGRQLCGGGEEDVEAGAVVLARAALYTDGAAVLLDNLLDQP
jgi:hypothetical protein